MAARGTGIRKEQRSGRTVLVIDFTYKDASGKWRRYRRDANVQMATPARAEADRLRRLAAETGSVGEQSTQAATASPQQVTQAATITLTEFVDGVWSRVWKPRYSQATQDRYTDLLGQGVKEHFGGYPLDQITGMHMRAYAAKLAERGVQIKPHQSFVSSLLKAAVEAGELAKFPDNWPRLPKQKKSSPDSPTDDEVQEIVSRAGGWLKVAVALAAYAGMRSGEVRAAEVRDVDLDKNRITIRRAMSGDAVKDTKDHEERSIPIAPPLRPILEQAIKDKLPKARLVLNKDGTTPKRQDLWDDLAALLRRNKMRHRSFHSLRHYFCSALIDRGIPVPVVQRAAGHSDLKTTQRYVHALRSLDTIWG